VLQLFQSFENGSLRDNRDLLPIKAFSAGAAVKGRQAESTHNDYRASVGPRTMCGVADETRLTQLQQQQQTENNP
jgi:hypothetical protein